MYLSPVPRCMHSFMEVKSYVHFPKVFFARMPFVGKYGLLLFYFRQWLLFLCAGEKYSLESG